MKKFALIVIFIVGICHVYSQDKGLPINAWETFEDYDADDFLVQQANGMGRNYWTTWSGIPGSDEDPIVSSDVAHSGNNAVIIEGTNDAVLLFGNQTSGKWKVSFFINVPSGFYGYFNLLQDFAGADSHWGMQAYFDAGGIGTVDAGDAGAGTFTYNYDEWTFVSINIDLDNDLAVMFVDDVFVVTWQWSTGAFGTGTLNQLSALNLYAWAENGTPKAYIDDIDFELYHEPLIFEPFEEYDANDYLVQQATTLGNDWWDTWSGNSGNSEDPQVTSDLAYIGNNSIVIEGSNDAVCLFGDRTSGKYALEFYTYVPEGFTGYFNLLQDFAGSNSQWGVQAYFDVGGSGTVDAGGSGTGTFSYNYNTWIDVSLIIDLNLDWAEMYVDDIGIVQWKWSTGALGTGDLNQLSAMNLYAWAENGTPKAYFDNIEFTEFIELAPPVNLQASVEDNDVTLTWNAPSIHNFVGYIVYRGTKVIAQEITETTYKDMDVLPGTHVYDVKAIYLEGYSSGAGPVEVIIEGGVARKMVVLEIGTGTWCQYCPGAAMGADDLVENGHNVAVIEYHNDEKYSTDESLYRISYYGLTNYPTAWFDGVITHVGGNEALSLYSTYLPYYETRFAEVSLFGLDVFPEYTGGTGFDFKITAENIYQYPSQSLVLHAVAVESHIPEIWPPPPSGNGIMDEVNFVCRKMLPDQMGTSLDFTAQSLYEVDLSLDWNGWNVDEMGLVVFLQDNDTKEILQATMIESLGEYVGIDDPLSAITTSIFPNPATDVVNIICESLIQEIRVLNNNGQIILNDVVDGQNLQISTTDFQAGIYFIEIRTSNGTITRKLVVR